MAYVLICALRRIGLAHTQFAVATCGTIRLKLLKIGAQVRLSVRRVKVAVASAFPYAQEFALAHARLRPAAARRPASARSATTQGFSANRDHRQVAAGPARPQPTAVSRLTKPRADPPFPPCW